MHARDARYSAIKHRSIDILQFVESLSPNTSPNNSNLNNELPPTTRLLNFPKKQEDWKRLVMKIGEIARLVNWLVRAQDNTDIDAILNAWTNRLYQFIDEMIGTKKEPTGQTTRVEKPDRVLTDTKRRKAELRKQAEQANTQ